MPAKKNSNSLTELSAHLAHAVEGAEAYTVALHARRRIPSSGVVWREGVIVSASHTVRRDGTIPVTLKDGQSAEATVVGRDPGLDLIVLRAPELKVVAPISVDASASRIGSFVLAVGRPGRHVTASFGIVSAAVSDWRTVHGARIEQVLRLDVAVNDGFSGGPLVTASGDVIGINNSALARGTAAALPAAVVDGAVDELLAHGHVRRPFIGVALHPVTISDAVVKRNGLAAATAVVVVSIADGSPADAAGILVGDLLVEAHGTPIARPVDLIDALFGLGDGASVDVTLLRGGVRQTISLTPADRGVREAEE